MLQNLPEYTQEKKGESNVVTYLVVTSDLKEKDEFSDLTILETQ